jgi:hypothetical protein
VLLHTPKWLLFLDQAIWRMQKKKRKTTPNQRGIFGALQTNVVLPKNTRNSIDHQKMGTWENC